MTKVISGDPEMIRIAGEFVEELRRVTEKQFQEHDAKISGQSIALMLLTDLLVHEGVLGRAFIDDNIEARLDQLRKSELWNAHYTEMVALVVRHCLRAQGGGNDLMPKLTLIDGGKTD